MAGRKKRDDEGIVKDDEGIVKDDEGIVKDDEGIVKDDEGILKTTAQAIGSTLGMLAKKVGFSVPQPDPPKAASVAVVRKAPVRKKIAVKKSAAVNPAPKAPVSSAARRTKKAVGRGKKSK